MKAITGATLVAGVAGAPVRHSLSPLIHNAWIEAAGLDAVYVAFTPPAGGFVAFAQGLRGGVIRGLNVTLPFKSDALAIADRVSDAARLAGAANLLVFEADGAICADNTDGAGLLGAFAECAPGFDPVNGPVVILGAGGAARGAAAAFLQAGCPEIRIANRTFSRAESLAAELGPKVRAYRLTESWRAFDQATALVNATSVGLDDGASLGAPLDTLPAAAVVMDMVYRPLETPLLAAAAARGLGTVDGLAMLIGQARPSFEAFFGRTPPAETDVRTLALDALGYA